MYCETIQIADQYIAVADAGSTGTRFFLYSFHGGEKQDAPPQIERVVKLKLRDTTTQADIPLSSLAGKSQAEVWDAVRPALKELAVAIPAKSKSGAIPLFIFATVSAHTACARESLYLRGARIIKHIHKTSERTRM
jgi:Golgi nucleoside diphosphatase